MKNPIPLLLVILGGAYLMSQSEQEEEEVDEMPTSLDYSNPDLKDALDKTEEVEDE